MKKLSKYKLKVISNNLDYFFISLLQCVFFTYIILKVVLLIYKIY